MNDPRNNPGEGAINAPILGTPAVSNTTGNQVQRTIGVAGNPHDMVPWLVQLEARRRLRK
ncbi:hypothetical protein KA071_01800 [Candidatus Gracilibacteria bacterium]|jgi:hypothetical protein|nr:hypothetical protein [Candidatus Gracilibacteria bacterium]